MVSRWRNLLAFIALAGVGFGLLWLSKTTSGAEQDSPQSQTPSVRSPFSGPRWLPHSPSDAGVLTIEGRVVDAGAGLQVIASRRPPDPRDESPDVVAPKLPPCTTQNAPLDDGSNEAEPVAGTVTNDKGEFTLSHLEEGHYDIWVESPEATDVRRGVSAGTRSLEIWTKRSWLRAVGFVQDSAGAPIVGAHVRLRNRDLGRTWRGVADARGRFNFGQLPEGDYSLELSADGFIQKTQEVENNIRGVSTRWLERQVLSRPAEVQFELVASPDTVAGATVELEGSSCREKLMRGNDGLFRALGLSRELSYTVNASSGAYGASAEVRLTEQAVTRQRLELVHGGQIEGMVTSQGVPIGSAKVTFSHATSEHDDESRTAFTDSEGRVRLDGVAAGEWRAFAWHPRFFGPTGFMATRGCH